MKIFFRNFLFILTVILLSAALLCLVLALFGFRPFILDSGSMEPLYKEGDFILANTGVKTDDIQVGDVLIYRAENGSLVMHRLIGNNTFRGDANATSEYVELSDINLVGKVSYAVSSPVLAFIVRHRQLSTAFILCFLILSCLPGVDKWKETKQ